MKWICLKSLFFLTASAGLFSGCGSSEEASKRSSSYGTTHDGNRSSPSGTSTQQNSGTTTQSGTVASYLFSLTEAEAVSPLVKALETVKTSIQPPAEDPSMAATRTFISNILGDMMKLSPHAPGRNFDVTVSADTTPNASALNEQLVINKGIITFASNLSLALVICHEAAHSTRNHSAESEKALKEYENKNKTAADKLDAALNDLVATNYNEAQGKFTHRKSDYNRIKPIWDAFWKDFIAYQKRFESEADVVGGRLCANAGFTAAEVEEGFTSLFKLFQGAGRATVSEGEYDVKEDELGEFLQSVYGDDTHPSDEERSEQIKRVKDAFKESATKTIATRWKNEFPKNGLSLTPNLAFTGSSLPRHRSPSDDAMVRYTNSILGK